MKAKSKGTLFQSVKGKILFMGILGIAAALIIGVIGISSINRNGQISEMVSLVKEISILQSQNLANDALYLYYIDESYLDASLDNLSQMEQKTQQLKAIAGPAYQSSIDTIIADVKQDISNYSEIKKIHSERGYDPSIGKYSEYMLASTDLSASFGSLINNNEWVEIRWIDAVFGEQGTPVTVDGKEYTKLIYHNALPVVVKRNNAIFRVGGTFDYKGDYYIKNVKLINGSDVVPIDFSEKTIREMSGDGLVSAEMTEFDGEPAIKVTANYDSSFQSWQEVSTTVDITEYDLEQYPDYEYELYIDPAVITPGMEYKYGGAFSGVYSFSSSLTNLNEMVAQYSKLVGEGKDVSSKLTEIESLIAEIEENIPKYTTDPALAEASNSCLSALKSKFDEIKTIDTTTLSLKASNKDINNELSSLCSTVQSQAVADMNAVRNSVTLIIMIVLIVSIVILVLILGRVSLGINKSVNSFHKAIDEIASGKISTRANDSGKDEFATFASSLNGFLDTLEGTVDNLKKMTDVLADSGITLEESANKTQSVASEISQTIDEISKGAGAQARDIETSSQKMVDIRTNISQILDSVSTLSEKSNDMSESGKEANTNMGNLTKSSDLTTEAFTKIVSQVKKTDASVGEIQDAVSMITSVANQINLLSLNASIEAARAGEAGKGFAVVASEISKLADQTNQSTSIIEGIINGLTEESNRTVETINEVTDLIDSQKQSIDTTSNMFENVSEGIDFTKDAVVDVLDQAKSCDDDSGDIVDLMTNLSAISEENAASAETTATSMSELNRETQKLAETSAELKELADTLKEDLKFFK